MQEHYDLFFEEVFVELEDNYGEIEEMNVCDNLGDHLVGNVYIKFKFEEDAKRAVEDLNNRWFNRRPMFAELSPVTDFREACCRQYEMGECTRSGFCNFMHLKPISRELRRELYSRKIVRRSRDGKRQTSKKKRHRRRHRHHRSASHTRHRSISPRRCGSHSPIRRSSRSSHHHSRSPVTRSRSPFHRSRSPFHRSRSPLLQPRSPQQLGSPLPRSRSPFQRKSRSPMQRGSRSPARRISRSPVRRISRSPVRRISRSPVCRISRSPVRRASRSPLHRSRSPGRRDSRSSPYRRSRSNPRRASNSPSQHRSSRSPSLRQFRSRSPDRAGHSPSARSGVSQYTRSRPLRRSSPLQRKSPPYSSDNNPTPNRHTSNVNNNNSLRSPLTTRKSPVILLKTPLLTTKTPLLSSAKAPLLPNKPTPIRRSPPNPRPPLIAKTPMMKSPLLAKPPPLCNKNSNFQIGPKSSQFVGGHHLNKGAMQCDSPSPSSKSPLLGKAPNCSLSGRSEAPTSYGTDMDTQRQMTTEVGGDNNRANALQDKSFYGPNANAAKPEAMNVLQFMSHNDNISDQIHATSSSDQSNSTRTLTPSDPAAHLATTAVMSLAHPRGTKVMSLADSFPHHGGFNFNSNFSAQHAALLGAGGNAVAHHHPHHHLSACSMATLHPFCGGASITTTPSYPNTLTHSHPFSTLSSLHLPHHASTFSSPLLPCPPPTPLLLGRGGLLSGVMGGYGRGVMGGLLGHGGLALGGFRLGAPSGNYGGRRGGRGGGVTLQEQLAKAAAAVRLNRPY
ncbi:serine/arginine repetitive matrix protein 2 isoform X2 [Hyalella azteca]|nr:serine/arginine repetitive matrix protein 2 isoform X2 [Hyalella azteca]